MRSLSARVRFLNFFRNVFKLSFLENELKNFTLGKSTDNFFSKLVPNSYQYPPNSVRTVYRNALRLQVDLSDYVGHYLYFGFQEKSLDKLFLLCNKNSYVLDVGANIGWTLLKMASISKSGKVIGFEPEPFNYSICRKNISLNTLDNVMVLPVGLGIEKSTAMMEIRTLSNRGGNRVSPQYKEGSVSVRIDRLDGIDEIKGWPKIDLIKIDVEGYELHVLEGAGTILSDFKPTLFIEVDDNNLRDQGKSARLLVSFLVNQGYKNILNAETDDEVTINTDFKNCHFDIIATK